MGASPKMIAYVATTEATAHQNLQVTGIRYGKELGTVVVRANPLRPVVHAGGRRLTGHFLNISNVCVAPFIDRIPEPLFGPARIGENSSALGINDEDMGSGCHPIAFYLVCDRRYVVLDWRRCKSAHDILAVSTQD